MEVLYRGPGRVVLKVQVLFLTLINTATDIGPVNLYGAGVW